MALLQPTPLTRLASHSLAFAAVLLALILAVTSEAPAQGPPAAAQGPQYLTFADYDRLGAMVDQTILFHGTVGSLRASWNERAPNIVTLRDGARTLDVAFWSYRGDSSPTATELFGTPGTPVFVRGKVELFQDKLQINAGSSTAQISNRPLPGTSAPAGAAAAAPAPRPAGPPAQAAAPAQSAAAAFAAPAQTERITLRPYGPLGVQQGLEATGSSLIYVRSPSSELSKSFEESYLLHADAVQIIGPRIVYHIDIDTEEGRRQATQLQVDHAPTMILLQKDKERVVFAFRADTTPEQALRFFSSIPR